MARTISLTKIEAQIRDLQKKAEAIKRQQKSGIKQLTRIITKYHLTPAEIELALSADRGRRRSPLRGRKLDPKYRNPVNKAQTWTGRGLKPKWVVELMKRGKKLEDLVIK